MPDNDSTKQYILPTIVAQPSDVGRLIRELGVIDEHLRQEAIRSPDKKIIVKSSVKLADLLSMNGIDVTDPASRADLTAWLSELKKTAPVINLSFGAEADEQFIAKLTEWFRREVDSRCLLIIGLEPSVGIGSVVRTNNRVFDLSLKSRLKSTRNLLLNEIQQLTRGEGQ